MKQNILGAICLSLAASIWGGMYVVSKYVLDFIPPFTLVWIRYIIAFTILFTILKIVQKRNNCYSAVKKKDWLLLVLIGFIGYFVSISFQFIGTNLSDAHTGSLITSSTPIFTVLFAWFILKEKLTGRKIISLFLATLGVIIVIGWETNDGNYYLGSIILVGAAITWALLSILVKIASRRLSTLTITTYAILFALIFTTPTMLLELQTNVVCYDIMIVFCVLYLGIVSTAGAFFLWNKGMELMDASIGSLFFFFQPIVGSLLGWLLLDEVINNNFYIGGLFIIVAVFIVTIQKKQVMF